TRALVKAHASVPGATPQGRRAMDESLQPFERRSGENPFTIQAALQEMMQSHVGIVRTESEMQHALAELGVLRARADKAAVTGHREYKNGSHRAIGRWTPLT